VGWRAQELLDPVEPSDRAATRVDGSSAQELVRFLGLADVVEPAAGRALFFPLGVFYPYSHDLRRVYDRFVDVAVSFPEARPLLVGELPEDPFIVSQEDGLGLALGRYLAAIKHLYSRTAFGADPTGPGVARAYAAVTDAITRTKQLSTLVARPGPVSQGPQLADRSLGPACLKAPVTGDRWRVVPLRRRPANGTWYVRTSSTVFDGSLTRQWGLPGDVPLANTDFDG